MNTEALESLTSSALAKKPENWTVTLPLDKCSKCTLYKPRSYNPYNATGNLVNPKIVIVGEAPGSAEEQTGRVFQGRAGQLMRKTLAKHGIDPDKDCLITNTAFCRPTDENGDNRKPDKFEIECCSSNLDVLISSVMKAKPIIVAMGAVPLKRLTNKGSITKVRGTPIESNYGTVIPCYHPAYILRNMGLLPHFEADLSFIAGVAKGKTEVSPERGDYRLIDTIELFDWLILRLKNVPAFTVDIETTGLEPWKNTILGLSFSWRRKTGVYVPLSVQLKERTAVHNTDSFRVAGVDLKNFWGDYQGHVINGLKEVLSKGAVKRNHNIKFDLAHLEHYLGVKVSPVDMDSMILHYLIDENLPKGLKEISDVNYLDLRGYSEELKKYITASALEEAKFAGVPLDVLAFYGGADADASLRICEDFVNLLSPAQQVLLSHFYNPLTRIYTDADLLGVKIDIDYIDRISGELHEKIEQEKKKLFEIAGCEFNPNSHKQLGEVLYDKLKLPILELTATKAPSTAEGVLKRINHPIISHLLNYRGHNKNVTTYIDKMPGIADTKHRVHSVSKLVGTVSGRLAYGNPSIQTIPRDPLIKGVFVPEEGYQLVEIDYSQVELRVMAWFSGDKVMIDEYQKGIDIHAATAENVFRIKKDELDPVLWKRFRKLAKLCNFGGLYGGSANKLMSSVNEKLDEEDPHLTLDSAQKFLDFFFSKYSGISQYLRLQASIIKRDKKAVNCFGRVRHLPNVDSPDRDKRDEAIREGINSVIQSTASDCTQFSIIRNVLMLKGYEFDSWNDYFNTPTVDIWTRLCMPNKYKTRFLFSIHDSTMYEVANDEEFLIEKIQNNMLTPPHPFDMKLEVESKSFKERWGNK